MAKPKKRTRYEVLPVTTTEVKTKKSAAVSKWKVTMNGRAICYAPTKQSAVDWAVRQASCAWQFHDHPGELIIKRRNGTIQDTRTYGRDPRRTRG